MLDKILWRAVFTALFLLLPSEEKPNHTGNLHQFYYFRRNRITQYHAKSFISPIGVTYGGTFDPKSTPLEMMNPLNVGAGKRGVTEVSAGLKGIGTGVFYKRSKTSVWDF